MAQHPHQKIERNSELLEYLVDHTHKEAAEHFGISLQRVHQLRKTYLNKLEKVTPELNKVKCSSCLLRYPRRRAGSNYKSYEDIIDLLISLGLADKHTLILDRRFLHRLRKYYVEKNQARSKTGS